MSDSETLRTVACQAPLSMGFSRHEDWSELPSLQWDTLLQGIFLTRDRTGISYTGRFFTINITSLFKTKQNKTKKPLKQIFDFYFEGYHEVDIPDLTQLDLKVKTISACWEDKRIILLCLMFYVLYLFFMFCVF